MPGEPLRPGVIWDPLSDPDRWTTWSLVTEYDGSPVPNWLWADCQPLSRDSGCWATVVPGNEIPASDVNAVSPPPAAPLKARMSPEVPMNRAPVVPPKVYTLRYRLLVGLAAAGSTATSSLPPPGWASEPDRYTIPLLVTQ